jgi:hypothetical protein
MAIRVNIDGVPALSTPEIEALMAALLAEVQEIDVQLGDRNRTDSTGQREGSVEYWTWRSKASTARNKKMQQYRALKQELKERNTRAGVQVAQAIAGSIPVGADSSDEQLLLAAYGLLKRISGRTTVTQADYDVMNILQARLYGRNTMAASA